MINRYLYFGFAFLLFIGVGFVIINSNVLLLPSNPSTFGNIFSLLSLFTDNYYLSNYDYYYSFDKNHHLSLDFYNIPLANAQEQNEEKEEEEEKKESNENNNKFVVLMFDRGYKSIFTTAKPILDKYGFKASIFIACDYIDSKSGMNWNQVRELYNNGYDIQSHGLEHSRLTEIKSDNKINTIVSGGKECLEEKGFTPTVFQAPYNKGGDDPMIVDIISKHFDFAFTGHAELMFLNCDGYENFDYGKEEYKGSNDCRPYFSDGDLSPTSRYGMKEWSHDRERNKIYEGKYPNKDPHSKKVDMTVLKHFIKIVERQTEFNKDGEINAIPIIGYHQIGTGKDFDPSAELFEQEMEYLYENGYKVITLSDLGYDEDNEQFYIKNSDNIGEYTLTQFDNNPT
jgi:peptidoglycan/xylan/chitin deacetylase (PgdA/CDA1 family)